MGAFFSLIGGVKGVVVIALILALGGWAASMKIKTNRAVAERDQAIVQRDQAGIERDKAITAAQVNQKTIDDLKQERDLANQALNSLQAARDTNRSNTVSRDVLIQNQSGIPANAARAAPVLGSIILEVQADRSRRRGLPPPLTTEAAAKVNQ